MFEFEQLFRRAETVQRYRAAPLCRSRLLYLDHRCELGTSHSELRRIACVQLGAVQCMQLGDEGEVEPAEVAAAAERWAGSDPGRRDPGEARRVFLRHAGGWLRFAGRLEQPTAVPLPHGDFVGEFAEDMRERGWSTATIRCYRCRAEQFVRGFGARPLAEVKLEDIDRALGVPSARDGKPRSRHTIRTHAHCLRSFFRFAARRGLCGPGLAATIPVPRIYRDEGLPTGPSRQQVQCLLASVEGPRPADLRDRALLLALAVYGLRCGELSGLLLDDINWDAETFRVRCPKPGRTGLYPLSRRCGDALARYLREARPRSAAREVFLSLHPPTRPLSAAGISRVVRRRLRRAGIECQRPGAHALRHACAQHLLDKRFAMADIGDYLGHRRISSTAVYAKVDLAGLRQVADFDLGDLA